VDDRLRTFARSMRHKPTEAERVLRRRLPHDIELAGSHFGRQALIGSYIVNFASRKGKLINELGGGQHNVYPAGDTVRTGAIEIKGYRLTRFWNNDVLSNLDGVLARIQSALTPTPAPSRQGGGELPAPCRSSIFMGD
jgi:very-short-patch-repair endonuclease